MLVHSRGVFLGVCAVATLLVAVSAETAEGADARQLFRRAQEKYQAGQLQEAVTLLERIAEDSDEMRGQALQQLLDIHARLGHSDQAIQAGLRALKVLEAENVRSEPPPRLRPPYRKLSLRIGELYLILGHLNGAEKHLEAALADRYPASPLPPLQAMTALTQLAKIAEARGDRDRAGGFWSRSGDLAREELDRPGQPLAPADLIRTVWMLADSYAFQGQPDKAIHHLERLSRVHDRRGDPEGKRDTLERLAAHHTSQGDHAVAEKELLQAVELHDHLRQPGDRMVRANLADLLGDALQRQGKNIEAKRWHEAASADYREVLETSAKDRGVARMVSAFWRLEKLYQKTHQYRIALRLVELHADNWAGGPLFDPRMRSEQGALKVLLGSGGEARGFLREAAAVLGKQSPPNLIDLPRVLNNLAAVEQALGELGLAEEHARKCLAMYSTWDLPPDLVLVETHNILGSCAVERGRYQEALAHFRDGIALCSKLGKDADIPHSTLLLNLALLCKSQGDLAEALRGCRQSREVYKRVAPTDSLGFAAFDAAEAMLLASTGELRAANSLTPSILERCRRYDIDRGPLVVTALHCQALYQLSRKQFAAADETWGRVRDMQEKEKQPLLLPRTLNSLALSAELQGRLPQAEELYTRARELQRKVPRSLPATHFITLWRLAGVVDRRGRHAEARQLLEEGLHIVEEARLLTYGDAEQRAAYFVQFAPGFERLIDYCLRDGDVEAAFEALTRSRSRTFIDQLLLADVDPRAELSGPKGEALRKQEEELRERISGLRARAQLILQEDVDGGRAKKLLVELDTTQQSYAQVWREILNASPLYRHLATEQAPGTLLASLRKSVLGPKTLLVAYRIGRDHSHLLLLGGKDFRPEVFPLTIPATLAERLAPPPPADEVAMVGSRGFQLKPLAPQPELPPDAPPSGSLSATPSVSLNQQLARALVDHYRLQLSDPGFRTTRGFLLTSRVPEKPVPVQRLDLPGNVLLPPAARQRIKESGADSLIVVPDGALHKLPLEALLLEGGRKPRYVLDDMPPIVYTPSAAVLALLADRPRLPAKAPLSLLTVSNPAYPPAPPENAVRGTGEGTTRARMLLLSQLPPLPFTAIESRRIQARFDKERITALEGDAATEGAVRANVAGKRMIHLAAHGFVDDRFGNLFGALAFAPPPRDRLRSEDDGFLSLHEIYGMPLKDCELAVLSACVSNVGPQPPMEAGVSLASGFLTAGARRVVASHWSVDDESTAALMEAFFTEITTATRHGDPVLYAEALQKARRKLRETSRWSAPYFWAPFVLVGSADRS
jgi:CHAT domain-containing protein/tetratricopeptide (TPR) repeat protein